MKRIFPTILLGFLVFSGLARADITADKKISALHLPDDGRSIYRINYWSDGTIILLGSLTSIGVNAFADQIVYRKCLCDPNGINFIDRPNVANQNHTADIAANWSVAAAIAAPIVVDYFDVGLTREFIEDMAVYTEVLSVNFGLVTLAKYISQRPYPYIYAKSPVNFESSATDYLSFYSGHTTTTFSTLAAASMTLSLRHKHQVWPWIITGVMGTSVAVELVASGEHFTTDVIVGALMGTAIGITVPALHAKDRDWRKHIFVSAASNGTSIGWTTQF